MGISFQVRRSRNCDEPGGAGEGGRLATLPLPPALGGKPPDLRHPSDFRRPDADLVSPPGLSVGALAAPEAGDHSPGDG